MSTDLSTIWSQVRLSGAADMSGPARIMTETFSQIRLRRASALWGL